MNAFVKNAGDHLLFNLVRYNSAVEGVLAQVATPPTWGVEAGIRF